MEIVYKLRHKPTGLFFKDPDWESGNVDVLGKVFNHPPPRKSKMTIPKDLAIINNLECLYHTQTYKTKLSDWEVVEFTITENA